jgi:hypothetical protein
MYNNFFSTLIFVFELGCDAHESGLIARRWYEAARAWWLNGGRDWAVAEIAPCVAVIKAITAWTFGVDRPWSAQSLPSTIALIEAEVSEIFGTGRQYKAIAFTAAARIDWAIQQYLMGH